MAGPATRVSHRRPFDPAPWSRRHLRASNRSAVSAEIAVQQEVGACADPRTDGAVSIAGGIRIQDMRAHGHPWGVLHPEYGRQGEAWSSRAQDHGGNQDMKPIEATGSQKPRDGLSAPFN